MTQREAQLDQVFTEDANLLERLAELDWDVPCERITRRDVAVDTLPCAGTGRAEWVLTLRCCGERVLYCTACTQAVLAWPHPTRCPPCNRLFVCGRDAYRSVEPFRRGQP